MMTTAIIGAGNMGAALYEGLKKKGGSADIFLCDHHAEKLSIAPVDHRCTDPRVATKDADCVVVAVKPQSFAGLMEEVGQAWAGKLIVSVMAGIPLSRLSQCTGSTRVVRSMPNLGAKVGRGVTGWCAGKDLSKKDRAHVETLFSSVGRSIALPSEDKIDLFTAIAGSGPAYVFGLAELLQNASKNLGLSVEDAESIATDVIAAASQLLDAKTMSAEEWRKAVTSQGGVTEAAVKFLTEKNMPEIFAEALKKGAERSRSLSSGA